ncbi:M23 family metallopeptidase, partial [Spirulina sp. 06S082]|uniref:M23 family metallopeptidase n=1 Tax=Spirulina sp. 06S082 TaxID=3110248 RepID=UPI002B21706E
VAKPPRNANPVVTRPPAPAPRPSVRPAPQPVAQPKPTRPARTVAQPAPRPASRPAPRNTQPNLSAPVVAVPEQKPASREIPEYLIDRPNTASARETNNFIDRTDYNAGTTAKKPTPATSANASRRDRPTVVLRNRTTGCEAVVQNGRLSSGSCGASPRQPRVIPRQAPPAPRNVARQRVAVPRVAISSNSRWQGASVPIASSRRIRVVPSPAEWAARTGISAPTRYNTEPRYNTQPQMETNATTTPYQVAYPNNGNTGLLFPLPSPTQISSTFGWRLHPIFGDWRMHSGTDISAPMGTPVIAAYKGEVAIADYVSGYGQMVVLRHEDGTQESRYAHLSEIFVKPGAVVEQGEVIGAVGSTGNSTGPHLHFEWRHLMATGWIPVDAGPHLEWAMAEMIQQLNPEEAEVATADEAELLEPSLYFSRAEELEELVLGLGTLVAPDPKDPLQEVMSEALENMPQEKPSEEKETPFSTYIKPGEIPENRIQVRRSN